MREVKDHLKIRGIWCEHQLTKDNIYHQRAENLISKHDINKSIEHSWFMSWFKFGKSRIAHKVYKVSKVAIYYKK
jgi:hypothetical protein